MKSLDYVRKRIEDDGMGFQLDELKDAYETCPMDILYGMNMPREYEVDGQINGAVHHFKVNIKHEPDADFKYFTCAECSHDGTTLFVYETIQRCLSRLYDLSTTDNRVQMLDSDMEITYTIGDLVIANQYDKTKWATSEKPWLQSHTIVFLPIIFEVKELTNEDKTNKQ